MFQTLVVGESQNTHFMFINCFPTTRTGRDETKRKTQERMERRSRKRSSSAGSEKMERVGDR